MSNPVYWLNGELTPAGQARLPVNDHGLLYGDGVFEGIRFYNRRPFRLDAHLDRLQRSARALMIEPPHGREEIETAIQALIHAFDSPDGYIRLVLTRGTGGLGLDPARCERPNLLMIGDETELVDAAQRNAGISLKTASVRRPGADVLDPRIKSLNYLNNILAKIEARQAGADEALLLNDRGNVVEGSAENLFIARGGRLLTPPVSDGSLDGITRGVVMEICEQEGIPAEACSLALYDLYTADECFLCGTGAELLPVKAVDGRWLDKTPGPLTRQVEQAFRQRVAMETHG